MSYNRWQPQATAGLRESLSPEEMVKTQILKCMEAFNENNPEYVHATVETLKNFLLTPDFADSEFYDDLQDLSDDWEEKEGEIRRAYERRVKAASDGCPDLVGKPNLQPDAMHFTLMWMACLRVCERKGITWRKKTREDIGSSPVRSPSSKA